MKYGLLILLIIIMASCFNKGDCVKSNTDLVKIAFRKKLNGKADTVTINSIFAVGYETALVNTSSDVFSTFTLNVDPNKNQTYFIVNYTKKDYKKVVTGHTDTLKLTYRPLARISATDCGAFLYFADLNFIKVKTGFDSIKIVNPQLLKDITLNVQIFL